MNGNIYIKKYQCKKKIIKDNIIQLCGKKILVGSRKPSLKCVNPACAL